MRTIAVLPVKRFALAKQRLSHSVTDPLRRELAAAMVADVLDALARVRGLDCIVVVTSEPSVASAARTWGAVVLADSEEAGQSAAVSLGLNSAPAQGASRALLVPGDCPSLDPAEVERLLAAPAIAPEVIIVPDRHGHGTNALLLTPPDVIAPSFGPGSCERHRRLAHAAGARCLLRRAASLMLDIDTGEDLEALRERLRGGGAWARRTRNVLPAEGAAPVPTVGGLDPAA